MQAFSRDIHRTIIQQASTRLAERRRSKWRRLLWPLTSARERFAALPIIEQVSYCTALLSLAAIVPLAIAYFG